MAIFKKIGALKICQTEETDADNLDYCTNPLMLKREASKMVEQIYKQNKYSIGGGQQKPHHHNRGPPNKQTNWLKKDTEEKAHLKQMAAQQLKKMRQDKNEI